MTPGNRPALAALTALNVEICAATGAGKGAATTPEAAKAWRDMVYARREDVAAAILDAERELNAAQRAAGLDPHIKRAADHTNGRFYIQGMRDALESVTRPA